jgi:hypothetical protein
MPEPWEDEARRRLEPIVRSTACVLTIDPAGEIDPKIALETGYAVLLDKPIVLVVMPGRETTPGLVRIATAVVRLAEPVDAPSSQAALKVVLDEVMAIDRDRPQGGPDVPCGRTELVTTVEGRELVFRCDRERDHAGRHHARHEDGVEIFWDRRRRIPGA